MCIRDSVYTRQASGTIFPLPRAAALMVSFTGTAGAAAPHRAAASSAAVMTEMCIRDRIKTYFTTLGKDLAEAQAQKDALAAASEPILK